MRHLKYLEKRQRGTTDFPLELYRLSPESEQYFMSCHWHPEYELIAVHRGEISLILDEQRVTAVAGDTVLLPEGTLHTGYPEGCVYDCIVFSGELLNGRLCGGTARELLRRRPEKYVISAEDSPELFRIRSKLIESLAKHNQADSTEEARATETLSYGLLHQFFGEAMLEGKFSISDVEPTRHSEQLKRAISHIENNYKNEITLSDIAETVGLSPKYLCRIFSAITNRSPIEYLIEYRVESACRMLTETNASLLDVSLSCGFGDQSYFTKTFKRHKSMTPREYRTKFS